VALVVFNAAVQSGPTRAVRWLQQALGVAQDGIIGPKTIAAAHMADLAQLVEEALTNQLLFEVTLSNWTANRRGWTRRLFRVCWLAANKTVSKQEAVAA
jgi:lysozyme family protein